MIVITNCCASLVTGVMDLYIVVCTSPSGNLMDAICLIRAVTLFASHQAYAVILFSAYISGIRESFPGVYMIVPPRFRSYAEHKLILILFF